MANYTPVLGLGNANQQPFGSLNRSPLNTNPIQPQAPINTSMTSTATGAIPGFEGLTRGASNIVGSLMGGMPSPAVSQRANAYFGAASGMPGSDFVRNRGFDLYGQQADQYRQRGLDDFLKLLGTYSGTIMPTAGQNIEAQKINQDNAQRTAEFNAQDELARRKQAFDELQWGLNRPWVSTKRGDLYDRGGTRIGRNAEFDWRNLSGII